MSNKRVRITYVKSVIGYSQRQKGTVRALGLRRLGDVLEHDDSPTIRGMLDKISHLVEVEEVGKDEAA
ncbi:MAG: 50S ribosomal protein L30 [Chloroflexota bacterium]|nr:50S ribosomal protein L30 [Anaerolineae bacterium]